ncbi:sigma-70 family RNA polymerase sigma factor [Terrarubrum flagellatum]|uniref:RNA polymerase sigma factor n=1 Tax=Terrirubrum flagellatum TaxID=2895980 RepID=UPI003145389A
MTSHLLSESLFNAARHGEREAIMRVLEVAQPDIRRYARAACRTSADAEDAAQEALWLLFRRVGAIRSLASFSSWLFTVVRRECLRLARRAGLLRGEPLEEPDLAPASSSSNADLRLDLAAAIEALPAHYREIILMRDVREMTIDEIAAALNATRQSTKARLHRARSLMREYLAR